MTDGFSPIERPDALLLILGTGPSRVSLEKGEYYGHPSNAFWPIMQELFKVKTESYQEKKQLLLDHRIALWDTLKCFDRVGSLDSGYKQVEPNRLEEFIKEHKSLKAVLFTGKKAEEFYRKHIGYYPKGIDFIALPSPSSANTMPYGEKFSLYHDAILSRLR
jgi:TDG/mug DNA glycosylase family protein